MKKLFFVYTCLLGMFAAKAQSGNFGIGTTNPGSKLTVAGSFAAQDTTITASSYTLADNYYLVYNGSANGVFTLPSSTPSLKGRQYLIKNTTAYFSLTINPASSSETIDGNATIVLNSGESAQIVMQGTAAGTTGSPNSTSEVSQFSSGTTAGGTAPTRPWLTTGNSGTDPSVNFIGTNDYKDFVMRAAGSERLRIASNGNIGINSGSPDGTLHIKNISYGSTQVSTSNTGSLGLRLEGVYQGKAVAQDFRAYVGPGQSVASGTLRQYIMGVNPNNNVFYMGRTGNEYDFVFDLGTGHIGLGNNPPSDYQLAVGFLNYASGGISTYGSGGGNSLHCDHSTSNLNVYGYLGSSTSVVENSQGAVVLNKNGNNVGIGPLNSTAVPFPLTVSTNGTLTSVATIDRYTSAGGPASRLSIRKGAGTVDAPSALVSGELIGSINFQPYGVGAFNPGAAIVATATQAQTASAGGTALSMSTTPNGSVTAAERMRIDQNGFVGIGTSTPSFNLDITGTSRTTGSMTAASYVTSSDARLKKNIMPLTSAVASIMKLAPVSYNKKESMASSDYNHKEMGFLAQDVRKVFPDLVVEGKDANKTLAINYTSIIPLLTKAIQEQQKQIEELKADKTAYNQKAAANEKAYAILLKQVTELEKTIMVNNNASKVSEKNVAEK